jgi:hypothetical protein
MNRAVLQACFPWLAVLAASVLVATGLVRLNPRQARSRGLRRLHRDEAGGVQSLSFVLTLPLFVMVLLLIVQVSQLMIGTIIVHYAAFAGARSALVWIPAVLGSEGANCISSYAPDPNATDQTPPDANAPGPGGMTYVVTPEGAKYNKIFTAAVLACMPICPSRDLGIVLPPQAAATAAILQTAYAALAPGSAANSRIDKRLQNKLAYAMGNTTVEIRFYHKNAEPPLTTWGKAEDVGEFYFNELGWQDLITVTVKHNLALLPGPGRLLARFAPGPSGVDQVSSQISQNGNVYVYPLVASATLGNEGEKPVVSYGY